MSESKAKTLDGKRTRVDELNTALPQGLQEANRGLWGRIATAYRNLSQVMAGMYTGVGCSGTPHSHHSYDDKAAAGTDGDISSK